MNKDLITNLAWGGGIIVLALGATLARSQGWIDHETTTRIVFFAIGIMVAAFGNRMPKTLAPSEHARRVARVGGWSLAVSGVVYAALWALAPFDLAVIGGSAAVLLGMAVTIGYCLSLRNRARAA